MLPLEDDVNEAVEEAEAEPVVLELEVRLLVAVALGDGVPLVVIELVPLLDGVPVGEADMLATPQAMAGGWVVGEGGEGMGC